MRGERPTGWAPPGSPAAHLSGLVWVLARGQAPHPPLRQSTHLGQQHGGDGLSVDEGGVAQVVQAVLSKDACMANTTGRREVVCSKCWGSTQVWYGDTSEAQHSMQAQSHCRRSRSAISPAPALNQTAVSPSKAAAPLFCSSSGVRQPRAPSMACTKHNGEGTKGIRRASIERGEVTRWSQKGGACANGQAAILQRGTCHPGGAVSSRGQIAVPCTNCPATACLQRSVDCGPHLLFTSLTQRAWMTSISR